MMTTASPFGVRQTGRNRALVTEVAGEGDHADSGVLPLQLAEEERRPVAAAVIHVDDLEGRYDPGDGLTHPAVGLPERSLLVEAGDDDGERTVDVIRRFSASLRSGSGACTNTAAPGPS